MRQIHEHTQNEKQHGFTLLEVVVVMLILAVLAGTVITTFNLESTNNRLDTAVQYEMTQIRDAIRKFKQDNPGFPLDSSRLCSPVDVSFLFDSKYDSDSDCETDTDHEAWDPDYRLGWRGAYMTSNGTQYVDIGDDVDFDGSGFPHIVNTSIVEDQLAIADPFISGVIDPDGDGIFQWRKSLGEAATNINKNGRPYLLFDLHENSMARIVSMGADGVYQGNHINLCEPHPDGDDYVLCIY